MAFQVLRTVLYFSTPLVLAAPFETQAQPALTLPLSNATISNSSLLLSHLLNDTKSATSLGVVDPYRFNTTSINYFNFYDFELPDYNTIQALDLVDLGIVSFALEAQGAAGPNVAGDVASFTDAGVVPNLEILISLGPVEIAAGTSLTWKVVNDAMYGIRKYVTAWGKENRVKSAQFSFVQVGQDGIRRQVAEGWFGPAAGQASRQEDPQ